MAGNAWNGPVSGTISSVNDTNVAGTILAANENRKGATFYNTSTAILYLALANTTPSSTNCTVAIAPGGYYELPVCQGGVYTGIVKGIWASDQSGVCLVTEFI